MVPHESGLLVDAGGLELVAGVADQRPEVGALIAADANIGGDHELLLGGDGLGGLALQEPARGLDRPRVGIAEIDPPGRGVRHGSRLGRPVDLTSRVGLGPAPLLKLGALGIKLGFELALGVAQALAPTVAVGQSGRQLVAAPSTSSASRRISLASCS